ncbi:hypothetical protein HSX37_16950|uniref:Uncharacterized protein n=1 Tax=Dendrosporobacter quercicolus TaxID=146817 RepID=A0A1G9KK69_9FIRM|nr:hypothetical protein [Dendrosporobacter quercicolus]NSL49717.1 hypothetical protein [Dendrosporobacter quercicolus DSM 1736]SDL49917.1 hypothetical protein SAMN04488502_10158 [Dendrosporobacter quercicolus]
MEKDESILELKNNAKAAAARAHADETVDRELQQSIYDEAVDIFGHLTAFADRELLDGKISIRIPTDFIALDADVVQALFPLGNRPQLVMGNEPLYFMLGFNHTRHPVPEEQIKEFPKLARGLLEKGGPQVKVVKTETIHCGGRQVAKMHFISQTLEGALYNIMFYANVDARLLIGFVNFRYQDSKRLEPLAEEIIASYRILVNRE